MDAPVEHEICVNCKKEIPHSNYLMHTAHCTRNIALCPVCKEPIPRNEIEKHQKKHKTNINKVEEDMSFPRQVSRTTFSPPKKETVKHVNSTSSSTASSIYTASKKQIKEQKTENGPPFTLKEPPLGRTRQKESSDNSRSSTEANACYVPPPATRKSSSLLPCKFCDIELPKLDLEGHENYCGARTDKCNICGEIVMFKYKKLHEETNHGFLKLNDEPGPRPSWDSSSERQSEPSYYRRSRPEPIYTVDSFDFSPLYNSYSASSITSDNEKRESYKDISRRLDCPAPQPPHRRPNPPTELTIPCEFCNTPIPHNDLIQHETGCRPDLARFNPRRRSPSPDDYFTAPEPSSPEVELPCEFCADMFPASRLLQHQLTCN